MQKIPEGFWIGTSSSAWQIEGNSGKLPHQKSWADLFYETDPDRWVNRDGPQKASDFYHRYEEDIETMARFGMNTFRFTIQWARFLEDPFTGKVSEEASVYYHNVIHKIRSCGMEPFISLEHWDIPSVLYEKYNGWVGRETLDLYQIYVEKALEEFHDEVKYWFAFTEPNIPVDNGYMDGIWYPFKKAPKEAYQAHFHKILATAHAVRISRKYSREDISMGVMVHMTPIYARSGETRDVQAAYMADLFQVRLYWDPYLRGEFPKELLSELERHGCMFKYREGDMDMIRDYRPDLFGTDYYFPIRVKARESAFDREAFHPEYYYEPWVMPGRRFNSDRGWEIYPQAIMDFGNRIRKDYGNIPWFISENGIGIAGEDRYRSDDGQIQDDYRIEFIRDHLESALAARESGSDCRGYLIWSFVDNVSAINAFKNRYGLLELDLETYERRPKKSLCWLSEAVRKGEV